MKLLSLVLSLSLAAQTGWAATTQAPKVNAARTLLSATARLFTGAKTTQVQTATVFPIQIMRSGQPIAPIETFQQVQASLQLDPTATRLFQGSSAYGFRPTTPDPSLDESPKMPTQPSEGRIMTHDISIPGQPTQTKKGLIEWILSRNPGQKQVVLSGNSQTQAEIQNALVRLIDGSQEYYRGLTSRDFQVFRIFTQEGLYGEKIVNANFKQIYKGLPVKHSFVNFTIKMKEGQSRIVSYADNFYPTINLDTEGRYSDEDLLGRARAKLGATPEEAGSLENKGRQVIDYAGKLRVIQRYYFAPFGRDVGVDINSGETFMWEARAFSGSSQALGVGNADILPPMKGATYKPMPLPLLTIKGSNGKNTETDENGNFIVPGEAGEEIELTINPHGKYIDVFDQQGRSITQKVKAKGGEILQAVINSQGTEVWAAAMVNHYRYVTEAIIALVKEGYGKIVEGWKLRGNTNLNSSCNAHYVNKTTNTYSESGTCNNTGSWTVVVHEAYHGVDELITGIIEECQEWWGDFGSLWRTRQPKLAPKFFKSRTPDTVRDATNTKKYRTGQEVHFYAEIGGGFFYKFVQNMAATMGEEKAWGKAAKLALRTWTSAPTTIPAMIQQMLVVDTDEQGNAPDYEAIKKAAAVHGIDVKRSGEVTIMGPVAWAASALTYKLLN